MKSRKRSLLSILLALLICVSAFAPFSALTASAATDSSVKVTADYAWQDNYVTNEDGSKTYTISTAADLQALARTVIGGTDFDGHTILLANDIVINEYDENNNATHWAAGTAYPEYKIDSIGYKAAYFKGTFDGQNHTISGAYLPIVNSHIGLFGILDGATIKNLSIENSYISSAFRYMGGIAAMACDDDGDGDENIVENCSVDAIINCSYNSTTSGNQTMVGGIVGRVEDVTLKVTNCSFTGQANIVDADSAIGGMVGQVVSGSLSVKDCINEGEINGTKNAGGVVGYSGAGVTVDGFVNTGAITATGGNNAGEVVGYIYSSVSIKNAIVMGSTVGSSSSGGVFSGYGGNYANAALTIEKSAGVANGRNVVRSTGANYAGTTYAENTTEADYLVDTKEELFSKVIFTDNGASIRISGGGIRFETSVNKFAFEYLCDYFKDTYTVSIGTIVTHESEIDGTTNADIFDVINNGTEDTHYLNIPATVGNWFKDDATGTSFAGSVMPVNESNYSKAFTAVGYVTLTNISDRTTATYYSDATSTRTIAAVAEAAYRENSATQDDVFKYAILVDGVANGTYSRYTDDQRKALLNFFQ